MNVHEYFRTTCDLPKKCFNSESDNNWLKKSLVLSVTGDNLGQVDNDFQSTVSPDFSTE